MTMIFIPAPIAQEYLIGVAADISGGKLVSGNHPIKIGLRVFLSDTKAWYVITDGDGTVVTYKDPPVV